MSLRCVPDPVAGRGAHVTMRDREGREQWTETVLESERRPESERVMLRRARRPELVILSCELCLAVGVYGLAVSAIALPPSRPQRSDFAHFGHS